LKGLKRSWLGGGDELNNCNETYGTSMGLGRQKPSGKVITVGKVARNFIKGPEKGGKKGGRGQLRGGGVKLEKKGMGEQKTTSRGATIGCGKYR